MNLTKRYLSIVLVILIALSAILYSNYLSEKLAIENFEFKNHDIKTQLSFEEVSRALSLDIKFVEKFDSYTVYYCHSPYLKDNVKIKNTTINCQLSIKNDVVTIGLPIILGGF